MLSDETEIPRLPYVRGRHRPPTDDPHEKLLRRREAVRDCEQQRRDRKKAERIAAGNAPVPRRPKAATEEERRRRTREAVRKWRTANPFVALTEAQKFKLRQRYAADAVFRLSIGMRNALNRGLARKDVARAKSALVLLGCDIPTFVRHIESLWEPWMTWANRGRASKTEQRWHLDHVRPLASFDLTDPVQLAAAFHYSNLQPLEALANIRKGAYYRPRSSELHFGPVSAPHVNHHVRG